MLQRRSFRKFQEVTSEGQTPRVTRALSLMKGYTYQHPLLELFMCLGCLPADIPRSLERGACVWRTEGGMGPGAGEWLQLRIRGDSPGKSWGRRCWAPGHATSRAAPGGGQGGRVRAAAKRPPAVPGTQSGRREDGTGCSARRCPLGPGAEADQAGRTRTRSRLL